MNRKIFALLALAGITSIGYLWGYVLAIFVASLLLKWFNHVFLQYPLPYWKVLVISIPFTYLIARVRAFAYLWGLAFAIMVMAQMLTWLGLISLPLFHLK